VLVHLYEEYGDEMVHALEGMYAFAIWDSSRRRLLIARDRFGEKPLFYTEQDGRLAFASELSALTAGGALRPELDEAAVHAFFVFGYVPGPGTIFAGARQLPPGHVLTWDADSRKVDVRAYWSPLVRGAEHAQPIDELAAEAGRLLEDSVRGRLVADVPVGVLLSGGVDSSLIAAIGAEMRPGLPSFTVGYDVGDVGETRKARAIARRFGTEHHELQLLAADTPELARRVLGSLDQPLADQALLPLHAVCSFARERVKVVVGGEGADEFFGGYPRYRWLTRAAEFERIGMPRRLATAALGLPIGRRAQLAARLLSEPDTVERRVDWVTARRRHHRDGFAGPRLRDGEHDVALFRHVAARMTWASGDDGALAASLMHFDQVQWLPDDVLVKADRASMLVGLELRTPYLHRELVEFAMTVPPRVHLMDGGKAILRRLLAGHMSGVAPHRRPKTAFRVPSADWLRGPLASVMEEQVRSGRAYDEGWLDADSVRGLLREHHQGHADWSHVLWPALAFGLWLDGLHGA
jgi:asparagine synthase (glutamine-hydrolysing)